MRSTLAAVVTLTAALAGAAALPGAASAATPSLRFHGVQYDSPGTDNRTAASLNAEWISLVNTGGSAVNLRGWTIRDRSNHVYTFGNLSIAGRGGRLWLHTGTGATRGANAYWNSGNYVWNNSGDTAYLRRPSGATADTCDWGSKKGRTWVAC
jgi:Lamin Tail Domain